MALASRRKIIISCTCIWELMIQIRSYKMQEIQKEFHVVEKWNLLQLLDPPVTRWNMKSIVMPLYIIVHYVHIVILSCFRYFRLWTQLHNLSISPKHTFKCGTEPSDPQSDPQWNSTSEINAVPNVCCQRTNDTLMIHVVTHHISRYCHVTEQ